TKKTKKKKRSTQKSIYEIYEPSELQRSHLTDQDSEIRARDLPERFQLRAVPVTTADDVELDEEASWIYKHTFTSPTLSMQEVDVVERPAGVGGTGYGRKGPGTIGKIRDALNFIRNQHLEVPFIAFYRKEYVEPELSISDLWRVWHMDEK
ncbi:unnamed protein product, partial [Lampetra planeri]